jgi:hypothetical protein
VSKWDLVAWILDWKSEDEAIEWVKRCPNPMPGPFDTEIRQLFEIEDFAEDTSKLDSKPPVNASQISGADVRYDKRLYAGHRRTPAQKFKAVSAVSSPLGQCILVPPLVLAVMNLTTATTPLRSVSFIATGVAEDSGFAVPSLEGWRARRHP